MDIFELEQKQMTILWPDGMFFAVFGLNQITTAHVGMGWVKVPILVGGEYCVRVYGLDFTIFRK